MKSINVNIIRVRYDQTWYDVCDELGMMVFGGNYSSAVGGGTPPLPGMTLIEESFGHKNSKFHLCIQVTIPGTENGTQPSQQCH